MLDTFEEVERWDRAVAEELQRLFVVLASELESLKLIVSGRAPAAVFVDPARSDRQLHVELFSGDDAVALLRYFGEREARVAGAPSAELDETLLREVVALVGGSPLTLKLAARVLVTEGPAAVAGAAGRARTLDRVRDEFVRGFLYQRVLAHVVAPDERRADLLQDVARASLALRSITPALIEQVVLPSIGARDAAEAHWLFTALQAQAALVADDEGALRLREELRGPALAALQLDDVALVQRVHRAGADFYARWPGEHRAELERLYHRLAAGEPPAALTADRSALRQLEGALGDLPEASAEAIRAALRNPATLSAQAEQLAWEQSVAPVVDAALRSGNLDQARTLLTQRRGRSDTTELHRLESRLHEAEGDIERAIADAHRDLPACRVAGDPTRYAAGAVRVATLEERRGRPGTALEVLRRSAGAPLLAAHWALRLELQLNLMTTLERAGAGSDDDRWLLELDARAYLQRVDPHVVTSTALIRLLAAAFGQVEPERLREAARVIGLGHEEDPAQVWALAVALAEWDAAQPEPGALARAVGVAVHGDDRDALVTAWLNALSGLGTDAGRLLDGVWSIQTPSEPVREAIRMRYLWWGMPRPPSAELMTGPDPAYVEAGATHTGVDVAPLSDDTTVHFLDAARLDWTRPEVKQLERIILDAYPAAPELQSLLDRAGIGVDQYNWQKAQRSTTRDLLADVGRSRDMKRLIAAVLADPSVRAFHEPLREVVGNRWLADHGLTDT